MLPAKLAFVDVETTGARYAFDRVIEIGIVRVEDNTITQTYNQLLNPQCHLPPEIEMLTGIHAQDLDQQPTFQDVKQTVYDLLDGCVFVAHNARFDYGFLKHEFAREEISFSAKQCCTVKLSRRLYPNERHHNLTAVMQRLQLECQQRHRAYDDAYLLYQFYTKIQHLFPTETLLDAIKIAMNKPSLPSKLQQADIDALPEGPGVYIFYGSQDRHSELVEESYTSDTVEKDPSTRRSSSIGMTIRDTSPLVPLYIGKSKHVKERVLSHFSADIRSSIEMKISQQVEHIETLQTAGELGALFTEAKLVKELLPIYNRMLRRQSELVALYKRVDSHGYPTIALQTLTVIDPRALDQFVGFFRSRQQAKMYLTRMTKEYQLCEKLLGLEKTSTSCFAYRLGVCKGACVQKEPALKYMIRFAAAFAQLKVKPWPFAGPVMIEEENSLSGQKEYFLVDKWCYIGSVKQDEYSHLNESLQQDIQFDLDTYKILRRFFQNPNNARKIKTNGGVMPNSLHHSLRYFSDENSCIE